MPKGVGLKPKDRKLAVRSDKQLANQWQATPQQNDFMEAWLDPRSQTFGNAFKSALKAGYSDKYANQIASPAINNLWVQEYKKKLNLTEEHIRQGIQSLAISAENAKSPDDTRLKAYEILARITGLDNRNGTGMTVNIVQPILSGRSVSKTREPVDGTSTTATQTPLEQYTEHQEQVNTPTNPTHVIEGELIPD